MQITIEAPDTLPAERIQQRIKELEQSLQLEAQFFESLINTQQTATNNNDPWTNADITLPSVDTGIEDFALNHDHYLYGVDKK